MAASGFTPISLYYSTTASAVPTSGNLANGELGLNIADMKLYAKNSAGTVTLLASSGGAAGTVSSVAVSGGTTGLTTSGGPITTSGTITLAGTLATTNGGTGLTSFTSGGVVYASSSSALATGSALTFNGTQLGVDATIDTNYTATFGGIGRGKFAPTTTTGSAYALFVNAGGGFHVGKDNSAGGSFGTAYANYFFDSTANPFIWYSPGELMRLNSTGLGIGTSSPAAKLEVVAGTGNVSTGWFRTGDATAANNAGGGFQATSSATAGSRNSRMWLDADGANFAGSDYFYIDKVGNSGDVFLVQQSNAAMTFQTSGVERGRFTSGGLFGIGTTNPQTILQVNAAAPTIRIEESTTGGSKRLEMGVTSGGQAFIGANQSAQTLQLQTLGSTRFEIGASGQFGIGGATYGTAGEVLTSGGSGAAPTWAAAGGGSQAFVAFGSTGGY